MSEERNLFLTQLYRQYYDPLVLYCCRRLIGEPDAMGQAEQYVQEAFIRAAESYEELRSHPNIKGWLYKTVEHILYNEQAKNYRRSKMHSFSLDKENGRQVPEAIDVIQAYVDQEDYHERMKKVYQVLNDNQLVLFEEHFQNERPLKEISKVQGLAIGTVKSRIHRLRKILMEIFREKDGKEK